MSNRRGIDARQRQSGSPKYSGNQTLDLHDLLHLARTDVGRVAGICQRRFRARDSALRQARYEDAAVAVAIFYAISRSRSLLNLFEETYEGTFHREPNHGKLLRESFIFLYGDKRKGAAGTDAIALRGAVRANVPPKKIPGFIKDAGGLERLRREGAERAKFAADSPTISLHVKPDGLRRFEDMALGHVIIAKIKKMRGPAAGVPLYVVGGIREC